MSLNLRIKIFVKPLQNLCEAALKWKKKYVGSVVSSIEKKRLLDYNSQNCSPLFLKNHRYLIFTICITTFYNMTLGNSI